MPHEIIDILRTTVERLRRATATLSEDDLAAEPVPGEWSVGYIIAHLRAAEDVLGDQMIRIVREDQPAWRHLSPREYMRRTDYANWPVGPALDELAQHRARLLTDLEPLPAGAWQRTARVTDAPGKVVDHTLRFYGDWLAAHEREHLAQISEVVRVIEERRA
jgi:uncharacterized damage-inducible protein DinB